GKPGQPAAHGAAQVMLGEPVGRDRKWIARVTHLGELIVIALEVLVDGAALLFGVERVLNRRFGWLVVRRHRPVEQPGRREQPRSAVGVHDERFGPRLPGQTDSVIVRGRVRRLVYGEIGDVVANPGALLIGAALRIPPDVALAVAPRLAIGPSGGAVVHDVPVGGPVEAPAQADVV